MSKSEFTRALRAVIYIRYSSHRQDGSFSIEYQQEECEKYLVRKGYKYVKNYIDKAKTGKKVAGREAFDEMMYDAERGIFDVIIVFSFSRAFRNTREALNVNYELQEKHGIYIESVIEPLDMSSPHGKFSSTNLFAMHELQSDITAGHVRAGMYQAALQGYYLGGIVPFGYETYGTGEYAKGKERKKYKINESEAEIVRMMYRMYADGYSLNNIRQELMDRGIKGRKGVYMPNPSIAKILRSEFYIGTRDYQIKGYDKVYLKNCVPAIIDDDLWKAVTAKHEENAIRQKENCPQGRQHGNRIYELTGKLYCEKCGGGFVGARTTRNKGDYHWEGIYYICSTKHNMKTCNARSVRKDHLDRYVISQIKKHILNQDAIKRISQEIANMAEESPSSTADKIKALEKRRRELIDFEKKLTLEKLTGTITLDTFTELTKDFRDEIEDIDRKLMHLDSASRVAITPERVEEYLNNLFLKIDSSDPETLKMVLQKLVDKITVSDTDITLYLKVSPFPGIVNNANLGHPQFRLLTTIAKSKLKG